MNKTHGKTDELAAVDAVTQARALGDQADADQVARAAERTGGDFVRGLLRGADASVSHAVNMGAIGTHRDDVMAWYQLGVEHGIKGGVITGQIKVLKLIGDLANEMQSEWPEQADAIRIVARSVWATLQPTGPLAENRAHCAGD